MAHLREAEPADILTLMRESHGVWGRAMSVEAYTEFNLAQLATPWGQTHYRFFVLREGSTVEVGLKFYTLELRGRGASYSVGGIGGVYAMRSSRGRGQGTALLQAVLDLAAREGLQLAQLFSDIGTAYYARLGFVVPSQKRDEQSWEWSAYPSESGRSPYAMVRDATPDDLPTLVQLHRLHEAESAVFLDRDLCRWQHVLERERLCSRLMNASEPEVVVAGHGLSIDAYGIWKPELEGLHWWEHGVRPGMDDVLRTIVDEAIRRTGRERGTIRGSELPPGLIQQGRRARAQHSVMMLRDVCGSVRAAVPPDTSLHTWRLDWY